MRIFLTGDPPFGKECSTTPACAPLPNESAWLPIYANIRSALSENTLNNAATVLPFNRAPLCLKHGGGVTARWKSSRRRSNDCTRLSSGALIPRSRPSKSEALGPVSPNSLLDKTRKTYRLSFCPILRVFPPEEEPPRCRPTKPVPRLDFLQRCT